MGDFLIPVMPRKRKHSSEEEDEEPEEVERTKRRAAVEARDRVAAKAGASEDEEEEEEDPEEDDDDKDEDYEGEGVGDEEGDEEGDEDDEEEDENDGAAAAEGDEDEEDDEEAEDEEQEPDTVECILADLEEPTKGKLVIYCAHRLFKISIEVQNIFFCFRKLFCSSFVIKPRVQSRATEHELKGNILNSSLAFFQALLFVFTQTQHLGNSHAKLRFSFKILLCSA